MPMCEGKWLDFGVNANSHFVFTIQVNNVLLSNEIILCHRLSCIDCVILPYAYHIFV